MPRNYSKYTKKIRRNKKGGGNDDEAAKEVERYYRQQDFDNIQRQLRPHQLITLAPDVDTEQPAAAAAAPQTTSAPTPRLPPGPHLTPPSRPLLGERREMDQFERMNKIQKYNY